MKAGLLDFDRNQRRQILKAEERARATGLWGAWEAIEMPNGIAPRGWLKEIARAHRNKVFSVLERPLANGVIHLAVSSLSEIRPSWWEMQRIKCELAGETTTAVEVYPPSDEVVDEANMFHIWVLPEALPFSLYRRVD